MYLEYYFRFPTEIKSDNLANDVIARKTHIPLLTKIAIHDWLQYIVYYSFPHYMKKTIAAFCTLAQNRLPKQFTNVLPFSDIVYMESVCLHISKYILLHHTQTQMERYIYLMCKPPQFTNLPTNNQR